MTHTFNPHPKYPWFCKDCGYAPHERLQHRVSDEQSKAENPKGLSPQGASAVTAGQTPHPSPVDYTEVVERLKALLALDEAGALVPHGIGGLARDLLAKSAQVIEAQAAEIERLKEQLRPGSPTERAPTEWAYGAACRAIEKHRVRADTAEARIAKLEKERDEALECWREAKRRSYDTHVRLADAVKVIEEVIRLRLATDEGTLAKRADRMWEIACEALGRPIPGARSFLSTGGDSHG